ncbi:hypothetical protein HRE53_29410 (plasmid) [Acaryochloris sp. 'Moss Beach']|uniref:hypothetical protein n=1 Tax=Acaryochloris TaxID=155977 RepID=UPI001BAF4B7C|nr:MULTISPECIES: hypothetical protein [Acaryochloris]QUY45795.1 hypothetical protein I1H34_29045 [Acaryochloris marina S15]UJB72878.1 hypothetical protein HRE53_29410 [Acaryochloris sp. 'Moss Beach']
MLSEDIEGWRVGLKSETQIGLEFQTLEISGPGNLKIEIQRFVLSDVAIEGFVNLEKEPPLYYKLGFSYFEVANKCKVYLDYYFTGEPEAYLIVGCAHWVIPCKFAQKLVHVFLLG